ncbi:MAG: polyphosphate kinase 1 [Clostridia bacterium]|nr:polyphosphate kinase 1 [Clostridia bacterium]
MQTTCFENRELSWLRFNERVLEEAEDERVPLCERLSFLSIFQSNLDEFFMVRIGSLHDQMLLDREARENKTGMTPGEQIDACLIRVRELCKRRDRTYRQLMEKLKEQGITLVDFHSISPESEPYLKTLFEKEIMPFLSTFIVGRKQSFPFLNNKDIYAVAVLGSRNEKKGGTGDKAGKDGKEEKGKARIGIVPCSSSTFPRLVEIPERTGCYMLTEELILHYLPVLFPNYKVTSKTLSRITRNADIDADAIYDEDLNYRDHMVEVIKRRKRLCPVRMELSREMDASIIRALCDQLLLDVDRVFEYDSPLDVSFFSQISDKLRTHAELFYAPRHPQNTPDLSDKLPVMEQVMDHDVLLHYPYQSIRPFLRMLSEAARDPEVVSIRMTLYRLARDSKVVEALVEAAENGKQVDVLVELKARFDEENNIEWSRQLERAGCHVIYGIEHLKVHSKLCLITRRSEGKTTYITQIGTGNYNEKTSRLYTDLCLLTADPRIGEEALCVFQALLRGETLDHTQQLLVAPHCLQDKILDMIDGEISVAKSGGHGYIRVKVNSLSDKTLMNKLVEASQAGVKIDMIIRGICCLRAGVEGYTDNIRIMSVVGRFLEHSRIYCFGEGDRARYYISSADWMTRNTVRRVEVATPIFRKELKDKLKKVMDVMWEDNYSARDQQPDGSYVRRFPGTQPSLSCQTWFYDEAYRLNAEAGK